jgi:Nucleotidyltransferase of unknown function (DUF6036)
MTRRNSHSQTLDPWQLVWGQPHIDSEVLAAAIEGDLQRNPSPDYRTRLLVRDAAKAIQSFWGKRKFARWLAASPAGENIRMILQEAFDETGFPHIRRRLVDNVGAAQIKQIFTLLGQNVHDRVEVYVAGSIPTLIAGLTARPTEDIDIVNEVPAKIRKQRAVLRKIQTDYGLSLGHVQSHYLPTGWENRRQFLGDFGGLRVYLVDPLDIFVSKLSSKKEKHKEDLRVLAQKLDKETAKQRLLDKGRAFLEDPHQRPQIEANWQFIYQEPLFTESTTLSEEEAEQIPKRKKKRTRKSNGMNEKA